jgi:hypothetical protein
LGKQRPGSRLGCPDPRLGYLDVFRLAFDADEPEAFKHGALPVEPLPVNGSSTTPPGGVTRRQR